MSEPRVSLFSLFRRDRLLLVGFAVLSAFAIAPLFVTRYLPLQDLPAHLALSAKLTDLLLSTPPTSEVFAVRGFAPYWSLYVLLWLAQLIVGPVWGAKLVAALSILIVPLGAIRLAPALGRDPRLGLLAFALAWTQTVLWGFLAFRLGVGVVLFGLAHTLEASDVRAALRRWPLIALVCLTHVHGFAIYGLLSGVAVLVSGRRFFERMRVHTVALVPGVTIMIPWVLHRTGAGSRRTSFDPVREHLPGLFEYSVDFMKTPLGAGAATLLFFTIVAWPIVLTRAPRREHHPGDCVALSWAATLFACFLFFPIIAAGNWGVWPRYAPLSLLLWTLVPNPVLDARGVRWLAPLLLAALAFFCVLTFEMKDFGDRVAPFEEIVDAAEEGASLLPITWAMEERTFDVRALSILHGYIVAEKGGYDPLLFENSPNMPVYARKEKRLARPPWGRWHAFSMDKHGFRFDQVLVQGGKNRTRIDGDPRVTLVKEVGMWRLYKVEAERGRDPSPPRGE